MTKIFLNVKPFQETLHADMCGPASLKIVLGYLGIEKSERELAKLTNLVPRLGVDDKSIARAARTLGFSAKIENERTFADVRKWLRKGVPVIVNWFTRGRKNYSDSAVPDGHYSVVCGLSGRHIYLQDPEIGKLRKIERQKFMSVWFDFREKNIKPDELVIRQIIAIYE